MQCNKWYLTLQLEAPPVDQSEYHSYRTATDLREPYRSAAVLNVLQHNARCEYSRKSASHLRFLPLQSAPDILAGNQEVCGPRIARSSSHCFYQLTVWRPCWSQTCRNLVPCPGTLSGVTEMQTPVATNQTIMCGKQHTLLSVTCAVPWDTILASLMC